jgi:hypothetical protein
MAFMKATGEESNLVNGQKKQKQFYLLRDLLATVGLGFSWFIESVRLLLATRVSSLFSIIFIST